jgi:hypothetical protein
MRGGRRNRICSEQLLGPCLTQRVGTASRGGAEKLEAIGNPRRTQVREVVWAGEAGT